MRFAQFLVPGLVWYVVNPWYFTIGLAMFLFGPFWWVYEYKKWWARGLQPGYAFVEYAIGAMLAVNVLALVWLT